MLKKKRPAPNDPKWPNGGFNQTKLLAIYQFECARLASEIVDGIDRLVAMTPKHVNAELMVEREPIELATLIAGNAARLADLFFPEDGEISHRNRERGKSLHALVGGQTMPVIRSRALRNSFEHFAQKLDAANLFFTRLGLSAERLILFNVAVPILERVPMPDPDFQYEMYRTPHTRGAVCFPIRVWSWGQRQFFNLKAVTSFDELRAEACPWIGKRPSPRRWVSHTRRTCVQGFRKGTRVRPTPPHPASRTRV